MRGSRKNRTKKKGRQKEINKLVDSLKKSKCSNNETLKRWGGDGEDKKEKQTATLNPNSVYKCDRNLCIP